MASHFHGTPCWYELMTTDLEAARDFYAAVIGWGFSDAGMTGFRYLLANIGGSDVAGFMLPPMPDAPPPFWMVYLAVEDCAETARAIAASGGAVHKGPAEIPNVGQFAIVSDPQGAVFALLQPLPGSTGGGAFNPRLPGHGNWHELQTPDQAAAQDFYGDMFGWEKTASMPMGDFGSYDIVAANGTDLGGMMPLNTGVTRPFWLPYFGVGGIGAAMERITAQGGAVTNGPHEVPGGAHVVQATDPQGAAFALVGPK